MLQASKTNVIDDAVLSNDILYEPGEKVDHTVIIEYLPYLGKPVSVTKNPIERNISFTISPYPLC